MLSSSARAQWITQSFELKPGWNAIFTHVDASHTTLDAMIKDGSNPIQEVWQWQPSSATAQFITTPQQPTGVGTPWVSWTRATGPAGIKLYGNAAYLVRVNSSAASYTWNVTGKPVPPNYQWTSKGLNFVGFSTPPVNAPDFESFLAHAPELALRAEIFRYPGGDLGPNNPILATLLKRTTTVKRGEAFWVRAQDYYNRYFGPFALDLQSRAGIDFGDATGQERIRLRNLTTTDLKVTMRLANSEAVPAGQKPIVGRPPLITRGELNLTTLLYGYADLADSQTWTLKPAGQVGSEVEIHLGLKRSAMTANAGDLYAGILRFTDSLGLSQVDIPVSAQVTSTAGLWVGAATVTQVRSYLASYQKDGNGILVVGTDGKYVKESVNTELGAVAHPFPLRIIIHQDASGVSKLLQRVFFGFGPANQPVLATKEALLDSKQLAIARRISATHLPFSEANVPWTMSGQFALGGSVSVTVPLSYSDQASNPFLHSYHPDHDNLNESFTAVRARGDESFDVLRQIKLSFTPPATDDFASVVGGNQNLTGSYSETISFLGKGAESRQFETQGVVTLNRVSAVSTLTTE